MNAGPEPSIASASGVTMLQRQSLGLLLALVVQAVLGVGLTMYVAVPPSISVTKVFVSIPLLTAHIVLGFALLAGTAYLLWACYRRGPAGVTWPAALAFLATLVAIQEGFAYTFTLNNDYSVGMVVAFLVALVAVGWVAYRLRGAAAPTSPAAPAPP
jgi:hypothetical protein